jgi:hypothetical protein
MIKVFLKTTQNPVQLIQRAVLDNDLAGAFAAMPNDDRRAEPLGNSIFKSPDIGIL